MRRILLASAGLVLLTAFAAKAEPEPVEYVQLCETGSYSGYKMPGTESCLNPLTGEVQGPLFSLDPGSTIAIQGVALALAMPTPVIEAGDRFAVAANVAEYEGFWAFALAGAFRVRNNASISTGLGYGVDMQTWSGRLALNVAFGEDAGEAPDGGLLAFADGGADAVAIPPGPRYGITANGAFYGGGFLQDFPLGEANRGQLEAWTFGGLLRAGWSRPGLGAQVDLWGETNDYYYFAGGLGDTPSTKVSGLAAHLNWRPTPEQRLGGFVSVGDRSGGRAFFAAAGAEGQMARGPFVFGAQAGYVLPTNVNYNQLPFHGAYWGHLSAAYFPQPNLSLELNGGAAYVPVLRNGGGTHEQFDASYLRWGGKVEYRPNDKNFSLYGEYMGSEASLAGYFNGGLPHLSVYEHKLVAGIRFFRNEPTLYDSAVYGASLADRNPSYGVNWMQTP